MPPRPDILGLSYAHVFPQLGVMPLSDNISIGIENFTTVALRKLHFTDQGIHIKDFSKAIEFQQENPTTGIVISKVGLGFDFQITGFRISKSAKNNWGTLMFAT